MPVNNELPVLRTPYINRKGEAPLTRFLVLDEEASQVEIQSVSIPPNLNEFVEACHKARPDEASRFEDVLTSIGKGQSLWQCMEAIRFHVKVTNASRIMTHQLVRARVGVTFSQQCTGDVDSRHTDVVMPSPYLRDGRLGLQEGFLETACRAKVEYVKAVDEYGLSIQEARYLLPMGLTSFIYMDICLGALAELFKKRSCTQTQTWEMIVFTDNLLIQIAAKAPWALPLFKACGQGLPCWWHKTAKTEFANTHLFRPDACHDSFEFNAATFQHQETHKKVSGPNGPLGFKLWCYSGMTAIARDLYDIERRKLKA